EDCGSGISRGWARGRGNAREADVSRSRKVRTGCAGTRGHAGTRATDHAGLAAAVARGCGTGRLCLARVALPGAAVRGDDLLDLVADVAAVLVLGRLGPRLGRRAPCRGCGRWRRC